MAKEWLTDEQVEEEILKLQQSPFVKLARQERQIRYKRRQYLYGLRNLEKKGKELFESGITLDLLKQIESDYEEEE